MPNIYIINILIPYKDKPSIQMVTPTLVIFIKIIRLKLIDQTSDYSWSGSTHFNSFRNDINTLTIEDMTLR